MTRSILGLISLGIGAGAMYLLDPIAGRRRRALLKDKSLKLARNLEGELEVAVEDLRNRVSGTLAAAKSASEHEEVSDDLLLARVRSKLGRYVSHPRMIEVSCCQGVVELSGVILSTETGRLISGVRTIPGVTQVVNKLEVRQHAEEDPRLYGGRERPGERLDFFQERWAPATRLMVLLGGLSACWYGYRRGGLLGALLSSMGTGVMAEAVDRSEIEHLLHSRRRRRREPMPRQPEPQREPVAETSTPLGI